MGVEQGDREENFDFLSLLGEIRTVRQGIQEIVAQDKSISEKTEALLQFITQKKAEYEGRKGFGHNAMVVGETLEWLEEVGDNQEELEERVSQILQRPEFQPRPVKTPEKRGFLRIFRK